MNTFLPYADFQQSAQCLDFKRLGKQRVEAWQIYQCLMGQGSLRWKNHPAVQMWQGYTLTLLTYGLVISYEWKERGYKDIMYDRFLREILNISGCRCTEIKYHIFFKSLLDNLEMPRWLGNKKFHDAMKSNLLRKDKKYYSQFGWKVEDNLPYIWGNE